MANRSLGDEKGGGVCGGGGRGVRGEWGGGGGEGRGDKLIHLSKVFKGTFTLPRLGLVLGTRSVH